MRRRHHVGSIERPETIEEWITYYSNPEIAPSELLAQVNEMETPFYDSLYHKDRKESVAVFQEQLPVLRAIALNPNCSLAALVQLMFMVPSETLENPAIPLYLLENPHIFSDAIVAHLDENGCSLYIRGLFGGMTPSELQLAWREFTMGRVVAECWDFPLPPGAERWADRLPRRISFLEHGFLVVKTGPDLDDAVDFFATQADFVFHFNHSYRPSLSRTAYNMRRFVASSNGRSGDWPRLFAWLGIEEHHEQSN